MTEIIKEICDLPNHITTDILDKFKIGYEKGVDSAAVSSEASQEEIDEVKAYGNFIFLAIKHYVYTLQSESESLSELNAEQNVQ